jgi:hypothetical protein
VAAFKNDDVRELVQATGAGGDGRAGSDASNDDDFHGLPSVGLDGIRAVQADTPVGIYRGCF